MPKIKFTIITLFPEALQPYLDSSMLYKAQERGIIEVEYVNLREFGLGPHKSVDDTPYGGGDGMLMRCEPAFAAIESIKRTSPSAKVIIPTPVGKVWNQRLARQFAGLEGDDYPRLMNNVAKIVPKTALGATGDVFQANLADTLLMAKTASEAEFEASEGKISTLNPSKSAPSTDFATSDGNSTALESPKPTLKSESTAFKNTSTTSASAPFRHYIILCPHYEGYDERILSIVDYPISLGNYVLTGGELPALILIDSITRLLPGVLGGATSAEIESFSDGDNLEYPQYTKPADFRGMKVPDVLLSGHHENVAKWRAEQSRLRTAARQNSQRLRQR